MVFFSLARPLTPLKSPLYQRVTALAFRANAAVKTSASNAARAATLYLFLFFMVESALVFLFWLRAPDKFFLAHALQFFSRVNNRPKNCKQKIKIFKRIFWAATATPCPLIWSVSVYRWHRAPAASKEGQFYSSDLPVVAALSARNPRMVQ